MGKRDTPALIKDRGLLFQGAASGKPISVEHLNNWAKQQENSQKAH